jgi:4-amino-4-deoxy-L-arabinose transferase-like glycosyltransferase
MNIKLKIVIAILLYCLALVLRLNGVFYDEPQTDEYLWLKRSKGVIIRLESEPLRATTHLGHPGIVPALIMAASEVLVPRVISADSNIGRQLHKPLYSARVACAIIASLAVPILFFGFFALIGFEASLLAALLLLFDPRFIGLSRIAHLDAVLLVLCLISVVAYIHSELKRSTKLKLTAGIFWGLAIATKPTAVALIFVFIIFKAIRAASFRDWQQLRIRWSDIWAVVVGHLVMAAIYTRLWLHNSDYRERLKITFPLATDVYRLGRFFQEHYFFSIIISLFLLALCICAARKLRSAPQLVESRFSLYLLALIGFLTLSIIPQVIENFMRFWKWTSGLSSQVHHSFNKVLPPPEGGYWLEFLSVLPELTLFGVFVSILLLLVGTFKVNLKKYQYYFLAGAWIVIWLSLLSVSSKQSWRYAIPIMPAVAILAAGGLHFVYDF